MASAVIGALRVNLGLDSAQFSAGLKKAGADMSSFASRVAKMAGAVAAAAVPALTALGVSAANSGAEIARLSQVANAAPTEFQGWAAGAKNVGIEQEKLADILKDTNDRIGDFVQTGGGPMADFFEKIAPKVGVTAASFRNLSGPQALQLYVSSLEKANVNQQDFTFYMEAMASDSTLLLPLLRNGGKGMAEYAAQAERLGAVMDNKTVAAFAQAKVAIGQVQLALSGFRNIVAAEVVPYLSTLATAFVRAAEAGQPLGDAVRALAAQIPRISTYVATFVGMMGARWVGAFVAARVATISLVGGLALLRGAMLRTGVGALIVGAGELAYQIVELVKRTGGFGNALVAVKAVATEVWQRIGDGTTYVVESIEAMGQGMKSRFMYALHDMADGFYQFIGKVAQSIDDVFGTSLATSLGGEVLADMNQAGNDAFVAAEQASRAAAAAAGRFTAPLQSLAGLTSTIATETDTATDSFSGLGDAAGGAAEKGAAKLSKLQEVMKRLKDEYAELTGTLGMTDVEAQVWRNQRDAGATADSKDGQWIATQTRMNEGMKSLAAATDEWRQSISSAFASFVTGASSFKDMLSQIIGKLAEIVMNSAFESLFASAGGTGILGGILGSLGIGANSNGTNNWRGGLTAINERGAEIVDLPRGTRIIPHGLSKQIANGQRAGVNVMVANGIDGQGNLITIIRDQAGRVLAENRQSLVSQSVQATARASRSSKRVMGL